MWTNELVTVHRYIKVKPGSQWGILTAFVCTKLWERKADRNGGLLWGVGNTHGPHVYKALRKESGQEWGITLVGRGYLRPLCVQSSGRGERTEMEDYSGG